MLVRPLTQEAHLSLYYSLDKSSRHCKSRFVKYWSFPHFHVTTHSYIMKLDSLPAKEVMVREDLNSLYLELGYKKGFGPGEVLSSLQKNKIIDIHAIVDMVDRTERKETFCEGGVLEFF